MSAQRVVKQDRVKPEFMHGFENVGDMRWAELECAAAVLGLAGVIHLGYRDSGMAGSEDNKNPEALVNAPVEEVAGRIVKILRDIRPQVVVTHDPIGGYRHPDHIAVHNATVKAFYAAGDPGKVSRGGGCISARETIFPCHAEAGFKNCGPHFTPIRQGPQQIRKE